MSYMGVPSIRSAPITSISLSVICLIRTEDKPSPLGRKGDLVAKTPKRLFPPNRGGRTVNLISLDEGLAENPHINHK